MITTVTARATLVTLFLFLATALGALGCSKTPPRPGQAEFTAANDSIDTFSSEVGFGNTPAATDVAKKFAVRLKKAEAEAFTGGKDAQQDSFTKGNFLTYCQMRGNDVVLLVQAPNLDTYEGDVRKALFELAWETAQGVLGASSTKNLVVALRGKLLFGAVGTGKASGAAPAPKMGTSVEESDLYAYFTAGAVAPGAAPAAPGAAAAAAAK